MHGRIATLGIAVSTIAAIPSTAALGQPCRVIYWQDFSCDPEWITDQPDNYYWDSKTETFHATTENVPSREPPPPPTRYAYTLVEYNGTSMRLEFDIQPTNLEWSAGVHFGLLDENLTAWYQADPDVHFVNVHMDHSDPGRNLHLGIQGGSGVFQQADLLNVLTDGILYHCVLEYVSSTDTVTLTVTDGNEGEPLKLEITDVGGLPDDLDYLGFARDPIGADCLPCPPGCGGFNCLAQATANLDNVQLLEVPACPGDLNGDGSVGASDLLILLAFWGPCAPVCLGDLDGDDIVGASDLLALLANWGPCP
ncbi:MAG: hypothetical protein V3T53_05210 [Phycisphaerales bacterium]